MRISRTAVAVALTAMSAARSLAQSPDRTALDTLRDTIPSLRDTIPSGFWDDRRNAGLRITTGRTYNRVEGLPVMVGPWIRDSLGAVELRADVLGIVRTADSFRWDAGNVGHRIVLDARQVNPAGRGWNATLSSFDVVDAVETWQMGVAESGLATFFFHRDYQDYFGRHGLKASAAVMMSARSSISVDWSDERWSSREARKVFTIWKNGSGFRPNPTLDAGRFHIATLRARLDSRNTPEAPATGFNLLAEYELGMGRIVTPGTMSAFARPRPPGRVTYGRVFFDLRGYNRISPAAQVNARLVFGGWLHGDPLPMERRLSVGGAGTLPGYDFRNASLPGPDVFQCNSGSFVPPGVPAQCERVALAQLEYRSELHAHFLDVLNSRPIRIRGVGLTVRPTAVAFVDAGRGWLVGRPSDRIRYGSSDIPPPASFRTDVGLGLDLGLIGIYAAKAVSVSDEPMNVSVRVSRRF